MTSACCPSASRASSDQLVALLQTPSRRLRSAAAKSASGQSAYGRAAPQGERLGQGVGRAAVVPGGEQGAATGAQLGELPGVELAVLEHQRVASLAADHELPRRTHRTLRFERGAQAYDVGLQRLDRGPGRFPGPELLDQAVDADDVRGVGREDREEQSFLGARHADPRAVVGMDLQRPQNAAPHVRC